MAYLLQKPTEKVIEKGNRPGRVKTDLRNGAEEEYSTICQGVTKSPRREAFRPEQTGVGHWGPGAGNQDWGPETSGRNTRSAGKALVPNPEFRLPLYFLGGAALSFFSSLSFDWSMASTPMIRAPALNCL